MKEGKEQRALCGRTRCAILQTTRLNGQTRSEISHNERLLLQHTGLSVTSVAGISKGI